MVSNRLFIVIHISVILILITFTPVRALQVNTVMEKGNNFYRNGVYDNAIEEYFKTPPIKIIYCHDDYVEVQIREIDPFDEVIRGDIYCGTCSELIGKFDCTANGSNLNVVIIENS
ncbi:MAG: hypothetical protein IH819_08945 [Bacteroidetes bacterium]|nr:hypothetical protein [Bacteroidota bacterium]